MQPQACAAAQEQWRARLAAAWECPVADALDAAWSAFDAQGSMRGDADSRSNERCSEVAILDGVMLLWFVLAACAVLFVAIDIRSTPESPVMKWGFVLVTAYTES